MEQKRKVDINGISMAYVERGVGAPIVFLHGNPTSSFLWRNLLAPLSQHYRCLAPDLVGMGDSEKLSETGPSAYAYATHQEFLDGWFEAVLPGESVVLIVHDWGSALGFDWARRNAARVRGLAYMEPIVGSMSLNSFSPPARAFFEAIRSEAGERMVLEENVFLERMLSKESTLRPLAAEVAEEYRRPFREPGEGRRPTLSWPRLLPFDGRPAEIVDRVERYCAYLAQTYVPKLFVNAEPGRILTEALRERCRTFPNQREVTVPGLHYPQEDSPTEIAAALDAWLATLPHASADRVAS